MPKHPYIELAEAHEATAEIMRCAHPDDLASLRVAESHEHMAARLRELVKAETVTIPVTDQAPVK